MELESPRDTDNSKSTSMSPPLSPSVVSPFQQTEGKHNTAEEESNTIFIVEEEKRRMKARLQHFLLEFQSHNQLISLESHWKHTPPEAFICPITTQIFIDPVTLETGQTYERKAIQEWLESGNCTCPITGQKLQNIQLPQTNSVLMHLVENWRNQNDRKHDPHTVLSLRSIDSVVDDLGLWTSDLCISEVLNESENAILQIEQIFLESEKELNILTEVSKPSIVRGFVRVLLDSNDQRVVRAIVILLSEMVRRDKSIVLMLKKIIAFLKRVIVLFKKGVVEAIALIHLLKIPVTFLMEEDIVRAILVVLKEKENTTEMCLNLKTVSMLLLRDLLRGQNGKKIQDMEETVFSEESVDIFLGYLESETKEEIMAAVGVLQKCMEKDGNCRNIIANKARMGCLVQYFMTTNEQEKFEIIYFLFELLKLRRRTHYEKLLHVIKQGHSSVMHAILIFLQKAPKEQHPIVASLLLQLDLLEEPRKMSIYREEAIDALISCLRDPCFPVLQIVASEVILSLQGRFSYNGRPLAGAFLLKCAGVDKYNKDAIDSEISDHTINEHEQDLAEINVRDKWERKMAFVLINHQFGLIFEALSEGIKSEDAKLSTACFLPTVWLTYMLRFLPNTGVQGAAKNLFDIFLSIFISAKNNEEKILAMLAIRSFMDDSESEDMLTCLNALRKDLRELRKQSTLATEMLKALSKGSGSDIWSHEEIIHVNCSSNKGVCSLVCFNNMIFSGHSDGHLKVWSINSTHPRQETQKHSKGVTCLAILQSEEKLFSGSLDRTVRIWKIRGEIQCVKVLEMRDNVHNLIVRHTRPFFTPPDAAVKVRSLNGGIMFFTSNKNVRCLELVDEKLFYGCNDGSIQEIDLIRGENCAIQEGPKKLLGKPNPVYAIKVHQGLLYALISSLNGTLVKIWNTSTHSKVGSLLSTMVVRSICISSELIYLGCKTGTIEIWSKEKLIRVSTLHTKSKCKVLCMDIDENTDALIVGTSDGHIQGWKLF